MFPACFPPAVLLPGNSLPSAGSSWVRVPRIRRYYGVLRLPDALLAVLRFLRPAIPRFRSQFRSRRTANGSPGEPEVVDPVSSSGNDPRKRQDLPRSWAALVPLPCSSDPGGPDASGQLRCDGVAPAMSTTKASALKLSRLNHTALALATGTVRSMVGFAGRVTPPPRKTRFRPLARRYRTGLVTRGAAIEGFGNYIMLFLLLLQASWRKDILLF